MKLLTINPRGFTLIELMVVIVIIAILAAVAIPKFLDASQKAKVSEFPTQLTAIYTGQIAYHADKGYYVTTFANLKDSAGIDVSSSSRWFTYILTSTTTTAFTATASVKDPGYGAVTTTDYGTIDQADSKYCTPALQRYCPSWR
jgi:prepilin-type N-terminal cleavage/methylation domain-containing protein